ncbi:MAG: response regulator [Verrucomicrobia bacterium]|nr:response regulator [Pseudomonadota bacterium]MBS0632745.1 response regulator [Verrucomicrobiota bacterium]
MKKIRTLIIDDEPLAREGIAALLERDAGVEIAGTCGDGRSALAEIRARRPDLVFLDVQMPELGGLELLAELPAAERPAVVFVTAYDHYAVQAFEQHAVDYIVKPFRPARFAAALARAKEQLRLADTAAAQRKSGELLELLRRMEAGAAAERPAAPAAGPVPAAARLVFKVDGEHLFLEPASIAWVEAQNEFVKLRVGPQTYRVRDTLQAVEQRLAAGPFVRIHRSFIVNTGHIKKITPTLYGDHDVLMNDGTKLRLSRNFRDKLKVLLGSAAD